MIHVRVDDERGNTHRRFACGITALLPGDTYFFQSEPAAERADCPGRNPDGPRRRGTPLSKLTPTRFLQITRSWGYE